MPTQPEPVSTDTRELRSMVDKIDQLPLLPQVVVRIMRQDPETDDYLERLEELIKEDPAFAVRVLALANSAASSPVAAITTIKNALTRMGPAAVRGMVSSFAVQTVFMPTEPNQVQLWVHSVNMAVAAQRIAELVPDLKVDPGFAYVAGLLHDIGRFVMFEHASPELQKVDETHWHSPDELIQADVEIFKFTHSELGYLACKHWGLPDDLALVVRAHHSNLEGDVRPGSNEAATFCVQVADWVSLAVLEQADFEDLDSDTRIQRIKEHCLQSERDLTLLSVDNLNESLDLINTESTALLAGLGFAE
ncbi:MAG: HDOD domain-containing protein [Gammaproteobacteria bacterium]